VEPDEKNSQDEPETTAQKSPQTISAPSENGKPVLVEPDLDFIRMLGRQGGDLFKKCMQCGTCSVTCEISPDPEPFPRKEMAWATWGMKDRLLRDPDVWLCHQCNDCSTKCPRGARPGDVLAAVRQAAVQHWAFPRFLGRWANEPQTIPLLLGIPTALLLLALFLKTPIENTLGILQPTGERIVYSYSSMFPHWLLISFFMLFSVLVLIIGVTGLTRFWRGISTTFPRDINPMPATGMFPSIVTTLKNIITHNDFNKCTQASGRFWSHIIVFFGFLGLSLVALWIITARINPLIQGDFIYPFSFWSPWKILANLGGIAVLAGIFLMIRDRFKDTERTGSGSYFDWLLLTTILIVVFTGFFTEVLHYVRLEPHRHLAYFVHLIFVLALILYLPYSKLAHVFYRTTALVYAEYSGRNGKIPAAEAVDPEVKEDETERTGQSSETAAEQDNAPTQGGL
jgi:quinone-modifying oxidoreductase subunit QmoC